MATPTTLPATFVAGQILTAAQQNALRGAFRVLQVVSASKTDTFTTTSTSFVDVTGLSVSITPSSATSNIFISVTLSGQGLAGTCSLQGRLMRDSTAIAIGNAASTRTRVSLGNIDGPNFGNVTAPIMFLDSPATTASTTYKIQIQTNTSATSVFVNRSVGDADSFQISRGISTITVMEISA